MRLWDRESKWLLTSICYRSNARHSEVQRNGHHLMRYLGEVYKSADDPQRVYSFVESERRNTVMSSRKSTACNICGMVMRGDYLKRHIKKSHGNTENLDEEGNVFTSYFRLCLKIWLKILNYQNWRWKMVTEILLCSGHKLLDIISFIFVCVFTAN